MPTNPEPGRPAVLDREDPLPLWAQLAGDLRRRAGTGEFATRLPGETELVAQYRVSRQTVREALRRLRTEGLLVAERGRGSYLASGRFSQPLGAAYSLLRSIEAQGVQQRSDVLRLEQVRDADVARQLGLPARSGLVLLERRRLAGGQPLALDAAWLPAEIAAPLLAVDFTRSALYDELLTRCGIRIDGGQEQITPVLPTAEQRRLLGIRAGVAAFSLTRTATAAGRRVEWRHTLIRGDRFSFLATWTPTHPYRIDLAPTPDPPA
ncbi:MAG TPA: GntR family transcriptional regulator [Mycobacteriales bacterium]|nr:GntR family transcriptional regulator [Mycobacteriales bacterium]